MTVWTFGIDPGKSCGLAVFRDDQRVKLAQGSLGQVLPMLEDQLRVTTDDQRLVAVERFVELGRRGHRTAQPMVQQAIGAVQILARLHDAQIVLQAPADAKRFAPNDQLRRLDLYAIGHDVGHPDADDANDATRHALLALATRHATLYERLLTAAERRHDDDILQ